MSALNEFQSGSSSWRDTLKKNRQRTRFVIATFILIYLGLGFLLDLFFKSSHYPDVPLAVIAKALVDGRLFPSATVILGLIAVLSLWVTYAMYDRIMLMGTDYREIDEAHVRDLSDQQLLNIVEEMRLAAGLRYRPRVFVIEADYMNAFASGYSEKSAMVAITQGLMAKLDRDELTAVIAHELSHIRHMDIKLTLTASVLSNLSLIIIDLLFYSALFASNHASGSENGNGGDQEGDRSRNNVLFIIIVLIRYLLPLVTVLLMLYLSRTREYMADAGSVELMRNNEPLARALLKIQGDHQSHQHDYAAQYQATPHESVRREAYIFDPILQGISTTQGPSDLFSTHPGIIKRLAALGYRQKIQ
jgi:heat shock protein HtpX